MHVLFLGVWKLRKTVRRVSPPERMEGMAQYKRVLIKLSGEALGDHGRLFDFEQIDRVAGVIGQLHETGTEIAIVIGAGNIWRGRQGPAAKMTAINADHMGMLGTAINSIAM